MSAGCRMCGKRHRSIAGAARCAFPKAEVRVSCDPCAKPRAVSSLYAVGRSRPARIIHIVEEEQVAAMLSGGRRSGTHLAGSDRLVRLPWDGA